MPSPRSSPVSVAPAVAPAPFPGAAVVPPVLPSLTGLRWIAAFVVFAYHVRNTGYFSWRGQDAMSHVFGAGPTGVSLFFLLSGFVLAWSERPDRGIVSFWRQRLARIYPLHVVTLGIALIAAATVLPGIRTESHRALMANLLLVSSWRSDWWQAGNPVSWSLVSEAFFYLLFPLLMPVIRQLGRIPLIVVAVTMVWFVLIGPYASDAVHSPLNAYSSPVMRLPEFLLGVILARLMRTGAWRGSRLLPAVILTVGGYAMALHAPDSPLSFAGFTIVGFALLVTALARADMAGVRTGLSSRPLVALGVLSFPFYLIHLLIVQTLGAAFGPSGPALATPPAVLLTGTALALALAAAWVLHRAVEVPGRRLVLAAGRTRRAQGVLVAGR